VGAEVTLGLSASLWSPTGCLVAGYRDVYLSVVRRIVDGGTLTFRWWVSVIAFDSIGFVFWKDISGSWWLGAFVGAVGLLLLLFCRSVIYTVCQVNLLGRPLVRAHQVFTFTLCCADPSRWVVCRAGV